MRIELNQLDMRYAVLRVGQRPEDSRLVASLARAGQQSPVLVVRGDPEGSYRLIDGFRRVRALRTLARDEVEAVVLELDDAEALMLCYRVRARDRLTAVEEAWLLRELVETHGLRQAELAVRLERSESWVSRRLALVRELPESVQERVRLGRLCPQAAMRYLVPLARAKPADCERLVERLGAARVSVRQMAALYAAWQAAPPAVRARIVDQPHLYLKAATELTRRLPPPRAGPTAADGLVADLELLVQLCFRMRRRLREVTGAAGSGLPSRFDELWNQTRAAFESLERVLTEAVDARP